MDWIKTICASLIIAISITAVIQPTIVSGQSMYPTLENKDYLIVNKLAYNRELPNRGDIIVFKTSLIDDERNEKKNLVKRIIALPGDHLVIEDNEVYINEKLLKEDYLTGVYTYGDIDMIVPANEIFTMGDNRENSDDSRKDYIGTISLDDIVGEVVLRAYPFNNMGKVK
ncbi:signal peptidase I [Terrisporobacter sp.]|uniref:signal peptidase I n=1 Tax=Terrisporobacter sp. TaxID=1965305 RepID=UPI003FCEA886